MQGMDRSDRQRIGRLIKTARFEQGMTQEDLAAKLRMSVSSVSGYELGNRTRFARGTAMAFEEALGISDRRLLIALGYETAGRTGDDGRHTLSYGGEELGPQAERDVLDYIEWVRARRR